MMLSSVVLSLLAVSSAIPSQQDPCNPQKLEELKEEIGVNSTTTISDVIAFFDTKLAQTLSDSDFFQGSTLSPVTNWPLQRIKCHDDQGKTELILSADYLSPLEIIPMFMNITRVRVQMRLVAVRGDVFTKNSIQRLTVRGYSMHGLWTVNNTSASMTIKKGHESALYMSGPTHPQTVLFEPFIEALVGKDVIPQNIQSVAFSVGKPNFSLQNTKLRGFYSPSRGYSISLYGHQVFTGPHRMSILLQRNAGSQKTIFALTAVYSFIPLSQLVFRLSGIDVSSIPVIGSVSPAETGVMIATDEIHDVLVSRDDENDLLQLFNGWVLKGMTLVVGFNDTILGNHSSQDIIQLTQNKVTFTATTRVRITVRELFKMLVPSFDIDSLSLPQRVPNVFASTYNSFFIDTENEVISATVGLGDAYCNVFDINWLTLVFHKGVITLSDKRLFHITPHIELHAAVLIGSKSGKELSGHATLAISSMKPAMTAMQYNSSIGNVTVQDIMHALGLSVTLSRPLADASFPWGLTYSFSVMSDRPISNIVPPIGTTLQGTMNIIGYELPASITELDPVTGLVIDLTMMPIRLNDGLFHLYHAEKEETKGPQFHCTIKETSPAFVSLRMDGHASLLGWISQPAVLQITDSQYIMDIVTPFFLFGAHLRFHGPYGPLSSVTFQVYGELSANWRAAIAENVVKLIVAAARNATAANASANTQAHVMSLAQTHLNDAVRDLGTQLSNYARVKEAYTHAVSVLDFVQRKKVKACHSVIPGSCDLGKHCPRSVMPLAIRLIVMLYVVCVSCRKWTCCGRSLPWGGCIKCLRFNSCCSKRLNPMCNSLCAAAKQEIRARQQVVSTALDELNNASAMVRSAEKLVVADNVTLYQLKEALKQAKAAVSRVGITAASVIARVGDYGLFTVRRIEFDVPIALAARGRFSGMVEAAIVEHDYRTFVFDLRLENLKEMARDLAEMIFPGITGAGQ